MYHRHGITPGISFPSAWLRTGLGHPTPSRHTAWSPAAAQPFDKLRANAERARDGLPRSVCPFDVALGWCFTPGPIWVQSCAAWRARPGIGPFWACLCLSGTSQRRQVVHDDAYTPSLAFTIVTCLAGLSCLAQDLPPFLPASDACPEPVEGIEDQSHARGRCCHSCTGRIGVSPI